jgi:hypothetical protein
VSWWPADGHALDLVGSNHGHNSDTVRFEKGPAGLAFSFSGGPGEHVSTPVPALTNTFTLALWASPTASRTTTSPGPARYLGVSGQRYAVFPTHGGLTGKRAGCGLSVGINGIGVFEHTHDNCPAVLSHDIPIKGWIHVAVVYRGGTPTLFADGKAVQVGVAGSWEVFPGTTFGDVSGMDYGPFHGLVDEVMLFDRALSAEEIATLKKETRSPARTPLSESGFARLESLLSEEKAPRALFAVTRLAAGGDETVRRLRSRLNLAAESGKPAAAELIKQLDDDSFDVREKAARALVVRGGGVAPALRAALRGKPSLETQRRIGQILRQLSDPGLTPTQLRAVRAITVLSRIDTPASRALLAEIAEGPDTPASGAARAVVGQATK